MRYLRIKYKIFLFTVAEVVVDSAVTPRLSPQHDPNPSGGYAEGQTPQPVRECPGVTPALPFVKG